MKLRYRILSIVGVVLALACRLVRNRGELQLAVRRACSIAGGERIHARRRHSLLRLAGRDEGRATPEADTGGRSAARQGTRSGAEPARLAHDARLAVHHAHGLGPRHTEGHARRCRLRRHRRGRRQECHAVQARRRSVRRRRRRGRRVCGRAREPRRRPEAVQHELRASCIRADRGSHRAAGPA